MPSLAGGSFIKGKAMDRNTMGTAFGDWVGCWEVGVLAEIRWKLRYCKICIYQLFFVGLFEEKDL